MLHYLGVELILLKYTGEKKCDDNINRHSKEQTFICLQYACSQPGGKSVSGWLSVCVCLSGVTGVDLTGVTIQLWQLSKQQEGQVMTQQTTPAWLTRYILSAGVNEFSVRVFVSFTAYVDRCLPAVQMASMLLPSSTCCSLVTLPLLWLSPASATPANQPPFLSGYKTSPLSPLLSGAKLTHSSEVFGAQWWQACLFEIWE